MGYSEKEKERLFGKNKEHPSYGYVTVARVSSSTADSMFCSRLKHSHYVQLEIGTAERNVHHGIENCFARKQLIVLNMTHEQFVSMVAGSGTIPVTINWLPGVGYLEDPPYQDRGEAFREVVKDITKQVDESLGEAIDMAKNTSKRASLAHELEMIQGRLKGNVPYILELFQEELEKAVVEAKGQVDAHIEKKIKDMGLDAVKLDLDKHTLIGDVEQ